MRRRRARPAGHGGRGHARRYSEGEREEASEGVGKKLGVHSELAGHAAGLAGTRGDRRRRSALHGRHEGKTSDTWWASARVRSALVLGRICADLDLGPKMKFSSFLTLYISYLRNQVIRGLDQQVIRPQTASVSVLRATSKHS